MPWCLWTRRFVSAAARSLSNAYYDMILISILICAEYCRRGRFRSGCIFCSRGYQGGSLRLLKFCFSCAAPPPPANSAEFSTSPPFDVVCAFCPLWSGQCAFLWRVRLIPSQRWIFSLAYEVFIFIFIRSGALCLAFVFSINVLHTLWLQTPCGINPIG